MNVAEQKKRRIRILAVLTTIFTCGCSQIMQNWDDEEWPYPKPAPFPWDKWTPFPWDKWTPFPIQTTSNPWNRFTVSPDTYSRHSSTDDTMIKVLIFVPTCIAVVLILSGKFLCQKAGCLKDDDSNYVSSPTLHPPPRRTVPPPRNNFPMGVTPSGLPTSGVPVTITSTPQFPASNTGNVPTAPNGSWVPSSEMPPDYSAVILGDFNQREKFPEVHHAKCDSPPPYDEKTLQRF